MGPIDRPGSPPERDDPGRSFSYEQAFSRNLGLIGPGEQRRLRAATVAIVGMGGVGGIHLVTLARLGIGGFTIADPDRFDLVNFNRQYGASCRSLGRPKAEVMAEEARAINPEVRLRVIPEAIDRGNVGELLDGVDVLVDGIDFFAMETRRLVFAEARRRGIWALTAGPIGFSAAWISFDPSGMSFDDYFDLRDGMDPLDQLVAFLVGLTPRATHRSYLDFSQVDTATGRGPSVGLACHLCSGVAAAEVVKILLGRSPIRPAPWYFQFDAYRQILRRGKLPGANRHPWRLLKRRLVRRFLERMGWGRPTIGGS
ncbi:ThiF family adenylyltransferase [Tautonia plasticadhaerens]|uniref:tRNA threonylcarbamoyladenosine dehydratase n=1 Tax=Tautonia plasticadhaerens TaxID=2527974 RepID=A0A518H1R2_9BACT|nr:ThiF family adenylyltransferase [Tautonia plasticadhaerens]QDV34769.1 tRNA threonylcarbamoyladenosine dehydratase [Tautonia plasticadhaerens]